MRVELKSVKSSAVSATSPLIVKICQADESRRFVGQPNQTPLSDLAGGGQENFSCATKAAQVWFRAGA
jgi:hypothetical protein